MALIDGLLQELEQEARTTRRVIERVPDKLDWRPHPKAIQRISERTMDAFRAYTDAGDAWPGLLW